MQNNQSHGATTSVVVKLHRGLELTLLHARKETIPTEVTYHEPWSQGSSGVLILGAISGATLIASLLIRSKQRHGAMASVGLGLLLCQSGSVQCGLVVGIIA
jgi:hypothetical protein